MRRVVITGIGIISAIGNSADEVEASLRAGKSGIIFAPDYAEHGFRSQVKGQPQIVLEDHIDKRDLRFMGPGAAYNFLAMQQAIADSGLSPEDVSNERSGLIMGSGGPSTSNFFQAFDAVINKGAPKKMGPFMVTRCMSSTNSACLATPFKIKGVNYSITSACSTSTSIRHRSRAASRVAARAALTHLARTPAASSPATLRAAAASSQKTSAASTPGDHGGGISANSVAGGAPKHAPLDCATALGSTTKCLSSGANGAYCGLCSSSARRNSLMASS